jgi:hypothetical protein
MSKLSKSTRSLKSVVDNKESGSSKDEDIHLKDISSESLVLKVEPVSQHDRTRVEVKIHSTNKRDLFSSSSDNKNYRCCKTDKRVK